MSLFAKVARPALFRLGGGDAEHAHEWTLNRLATLPAPAREALRRWYAFSAPVEVFGVRFPNRVGLAAGMDKNGVALPAWPALGFGFVEVAGYELELAGLCREVVAVELTREKDP